MSEKSRIESVLKDAIDEVENAIIPQSRVETILKNIINNEKIEVIPQTRIEHLLVELKDVIQTGTENDPDLWFLPVEFEQETGYRNIIAIKFYTNNVVILDYAFATSSMRGTALRYIEKIDCDDSCRIRNIGEEGFSGNSYLSKARFIFNRLFIGSYAFKNTGLRSIILLWDKTVPSILNKGISSTAFYNLSDLLDIYVSWSEGEISGAPWGAVNATMHYDTPFTKTLESLGE